MTSPSWSPPSEQICEEALIGCSNVLKKMYKTVFTANQRKFLSSQVFQPIRIVSDADWLMNHDEAGQTFESFWKNHAAGGYVTPSVRPARPQTALAVRRQAPIAPSNGTIIIYIQPIGRFPQKDTLSGGHSFFIWLQTYCQSFFHSAKIKILPDVEIEEVKCEYRVNVLTGRFQLNAANILTFLKKNKPRDAHCVIAITLIDLFPKPSWDFVFGLASAARGVGVFSFARYEDTFYETWTQGKDIMSRNPDGSLDYSAFSKSPERIDGSETDSFTGMLVFRACKVMSHEICHMFGLKHCIYFDCVMNGSNHLQESDRRPPFLCPVCLRKLKAVLEFDILSRYKAMLDWSTVTFWESYLHRERKSGPVKQPPALPLCPRRTSFPDVSKRRASLPVVTRTSLSSASRPRTASGKNGIKRPATSQQPKQRIKAPPTVQPRATITPAATVTSQGVRVPPPPSQGFESYRKWLSEAIAFLEK